MTRFMQKSPSDPRTDEEYFNDVMQAGKIMGEGMPSPTKPALVMAVIGAGLGWLIAKKPLKWGLITGGLTWSGMVLAETSFIAGGAMGMLSVKEMIERGDIELGPAPQTPVVTRGHFAGYPRPLYNTEDAHTRTGYEGD